MRRIDAPRALFSHHPHVHLHRVLERSAAGVNKAKRLGPQSPEGKRLARKTERKILPWFRARARKLPLTTVSALYRQRLSGMQEADVPVDDFFVLFTEWLEDGIEQFEVLMNSSIQEGLAAGFEGDLQAWIDEFKLKVPPFDASAMLPESVIKQAKAYAGELVTGVTDDTAKQLSTVIAEALETQRSVPELAKMLRDRFEEIGTNKSKVIARTEMGQAVSDGAYHANKAVGATEKESIQTTDLDDICAINEADGRIPIDQPHSSGDMHPLYHPRCMCTEVYFGATEEGLANLLGLGG
ncbi:MAG: hypothetical protein JRG73_16405 [Deltaproteobacteria bacterium]|nr:hypothetical protein [Deltaproteobacteria bacterium]